MPNRKDDSAKRGILPAPITDNVKPTDEVHPTLFRRRETSRSMGFVVIAPHFVREGSDMGEVILHFIHDAVMVYVVAVNAAVKRRNGRRRKQ